MLLYIWQHVAFWITSVCMLSVFKGTQDAVYCTANRWVTTCFCVIKGSHAAPYALK